VRTSALICVGETLWDVLPQGEFLGGAPLNVAAHARRLGVHSGIISRVGADARGQRALAEIRRRDMDVALVQVDPSLPTGIAAATLDATGSARYAFPGPCAWDAIEANDAAMAACRGAGVVYGTLAQRSAASAAALTRMLGVASWRVFDANLRAPHGDRDVAIGSLRQADFVKLNEHEVREFAGWLGTPAAPEVLAEALRADFGIRSLCVTEGARGARLWHEGVSVEEPAHRTQVVDTIGAGDAFLAMLVTELLRGAAPADAMRRAARLAAFVASRHGALPEYDAVEFRD
jgi:fructokinase